MGRAVTPRPRAALAATLVLALACPSAAACARARAVEADVTIRGATVAVYVADSDRERSAGLQDAELGEAGGMLFEWPDAASRAFAIKRVGYPLDVVWISGDGHVLGVSRIAPDGPERAESPAPAASVLEVPAGWAAAHGIAAGDPVLVRRR